MMSLKRLIRSLLPGIFLFGFCIGTGSVTAMATAGADYGMSLLWTVLLSCLITFYMIDLYGKFTLVTGETALAAFKKYIHPALGYFFIVTLTAHVCGSVIGVMGILSDVCFEWSKNFVNGGIAPLVFAVIFIALVYALFLDGRTRVFENILAVVVGIMSVCFLINLFIMAPPLGEVVRGLLPQIPETGGDKNPFLIMASMVGTTVFSGLFIMRGSLTKEAGWTMATYGEQRRDAAFAATMMFLVSASVMAAAAGTMHAAGITLESSSQMVTLLAPLAGSAAVAIFVIGLIAAGVSSQFPNVTLLPWLLNDYYNRPSTMRRLDYRIIVLVISLLGLIVPVFKAKPVAVMVTSQAFGALVLPVTVACLAYLGNRKSLMREHVFGNITNTLLALTFVFAGFMSYLSYSSLLGQLRAFLT